MTEEIIPKSSVTDRQFYMDGLLKQNLNTLVYNGPDDWDSLIIVSGDGLLRVGKSVLAQQIAYYWAYMLNTPFSLYNIVFSGEELIQKASKAPKYSAFIYDESRAELDNKKTMEKVSKRLLDFFSECGMYNHFIILVLPDYFEMNKHIALKRAEILINVKRTSVPRQDKEGVLYNKFQRGIAQFYNRDNKKQLYLNGKKELNYAAWRPNFSFRFLNHWIVDKEEYENVKRAFIKRERAADAKPSTDKYKARYLAALHAMANSGMSHQKIANHLREVGFNITRERITQLLRQDRGEILSI